jgi:hypothetical protein
VDKSIVIIARNEEHWSHITSTNFRTQFPDCEIIGVDDGGTNHWPDYVKVIKTPGGIGVGNARRLGVYEAKGSLICITDGHVLFDKGDKVRAWDLASKGKVLTFTTRSLASGKTHGNGRRHSLPDHKCTNVSTKEGQEIGLIGGVYFMSKAVALDIIGPTPHHGFNEQVMTAGALAMGHPIYAFPSMVFHHLYKKTFNYPVQSDLFNRNRVLLDWWFFGKASPKESTSDEQAYFNRVQKNRKLGVGALTNRFKTMNDAAK